MAGSRFREAVGPKEPMRKEPWCWPSTSAASWRIASDSPRISRARSSNWRPTSVSSAEAWWRTMRSTPISFSSAFNACETADWLMPSCAAAAEKPCSSATRVKISSCVKVMLWFSCAMSIYSLFHELILALIYTCSVRCTSDIIGLSMRPSAVPSAALPAVQSPLVYIKLIFVALFWGGTFIAGRVLAQQMPPMTAASGRFSVAVVFLVLLAWKFEGGLPRLDRKQVLTTAALGLTGFFLYNLFFLAALARMPAGRTALFVALNPIVTALASALLLRERLGSLN